MPARFQYSRRVQFHETDLAGIAHFSWYFRYMEEAEHALWRALGMSIWPTGATVGYPRVNATCDFKAPLRFEDEFEVEIAVEAIGRRSIRYRCTLWRGTEVMATGSMTSACVTHAEDGSVRSIDVPESVRARLSQGVRPVP
ncbi:MAG: acyl-CoA thioesterase [Acidobacteria bacterium]|nr:acyl-CoA thioesterase [Acidobacteriota bacterium]